MASTISDVLDLLEQKIEAGLKTKRLRQNERLSLEVQQLFVLYIKDDHPKTQAMWQVFRPVMWLGSALILALIGVVMSGRVEIIIR